MSCLVIGVGAQPTVGDTIPRWAPGLYKKFDWTGTSERTRKQHLHGSLKKKKKKSKPLFYVDEYFAWLIDGNQKRGQILELVFGVVLSHHVVARSPLQEQCY